MDSPTTTVLRIDAWPDAVIDRLGFTPTSAYFEWLWLPQIGPSTAWAYRRLTSGLDARPDGYELSVPELAGWLGLGGTGKNSPVIRSLQRLVQFQLALQVDGSTLAVRRRVPPLSLRQLKRLSPHLQRTHAHLTDATPRPGLEAEAS